MSLLHTSLQRFSLITRNTEEGTQGGLSFSAGAAGSRGEKQDRRRGDPCWMVFKQTSHIKNKKGPSVKPPCAEPTHVHRPRNQWEFMLKPSKGTAGDGDPIQLKQSRALWKTGTLRAAPASVSGEGSSEQVELSQPLCQAAPSGWKNNFFYLKKANWEDVYIHQISTLPLSSGKDPGCAGKCWLCIPNALVVLAWVGTVNIHVERRRRGRVDAGGKAGR